MMGSAIFISTAILHIRKRTFERKLEDLAERKRHKRLGSRTFSFSRRKSSIDIQREDAIASGAVRGSAIKPSDETQPYTDGSTPRRDGSGEAPIHRSGTTLPPLNTHFAASPSTFGQEAIPKESNGTAETNVGRPKEHIRFDGVASPARDLMSPVLQLRRTRTKLFDGSGVGARGFDNHPRNAQPFHRASEPSPPMGPQELEEKRAQGRSGSLAVVDKYLKTINGYVGRNSQFHNLSEKERRRLGGIEYDAVSLLSVVVPLYFILWQLLGALAVGAWIQANRPEIALQNGQLSPRQIVSAR